MVREIQASAVTEVVKKLCIEANCSLPGDVRKCIEQRREEEPWEPAKDILKHIIDNYELADKNEVPICQDTGITCVFVEVGQDVHITGNLSDAINEGVRQGYVDGYLRKSVVGDPLQRANTKDNTPAMLYYDIVPGDKLTITVVPKGIGSENMSQLKMFKPYDGAEAIKKFVLQVVKDAGSNPCPPIVIGVGVGGTFDKCAYLAKKALIRDLDSSHPDPYYANLEQEILDLVNSSGIGPQGFGGKTTALKVNVEMTGTHIAGLPVAVNINCHVARHVSEVL